MGSLEAWLLLRSLRTLHLRVPKQSETATKLAQWLNGASQVSHINYPFNSLPHVHAGEGGGWNPSWSDRQSLALQSARQPARPWPCACFTFTFALLAAETERDGQDRVP